MFPLVNTGFFVSKPSECDLFALGKYNYVELTDMIVNQGYIPVASADEFDLIDSGVSETMGVGSCWEGAYTTGGAGKYVQVYNLDFNGWGTWSSPILGNGILFDGNELSISNMSSTQPLFDCTSNQGDFENISVFNCENNTGGAYQSFIVKRAGSGSIDNCHIYSSEIIGSNIETGAILGRLSLTSGATFSITNCTVDHDTSISGGNNTAGILGTSIGTITGRSDVTISGCSVAASITGSGGWCCGITGESKGITVSECSFTGEIDSTGVFASGIGGGYQNATPAHGALIKDCTVSGATINSTTVAVSGISICAGGVDILRCKIIDSTVSSTYSGTNGRASLIGGYFVYNASSSIVETYADNCILSCPNGDDIGGVVCYNLASSSAHTITDSYIKDCTITGRNRVGACLGNRNGNITVTNVWSNSSVIANSSGGGLFGSGASGSVSNSYWDLTTSGQLTSAGGTGKTTVELQTPTTNSGIYSTWTIPPWDFGTATDYPTLTTTP